MWLRLFHPSPCLPQFARFVVVVLVAVSVHLIGDPACIIDRVDDRGAVVRGVDSLVGTQVSAPDIRAGAALVVAGLVAVGETRIDNVHHIDRGYDDLVGRLAQLGADVTRVES